MSEFNERTCSVSDCYACDDLVQSRSQIVNGSGKTDADIMIVGEAPGENEDKQGKPFVGRSGEYLVETLNDNGLEREGVRITNTVRCRPEDNRDPSKDEIENCKGFLEKEIEIVDPEVILCLGKKASSALKGNNVKIGSISGDEEKITINGQKYNVVFCYHPAATFYNNSLEESFEQVISDVIENYHSNGEKDNSQFFQFNLSDWI